jgi:hypothetical protein
LQTKLQVCEAFNKINDAIHVSTAYVKWELDGVFRRCISNSPNCLEVDDVKLISAETVLSSRSMARSTTAGNDAMIVSIIPGVILVGPCLATRSRFTVDNIGAV